MTTMSLRRSTRASSRPNIATTIQAPAALSNTTRSKKRPAEKVVEVVSNKRSGKPNTNGSKETGSTFAEPDGPITPLKKQANTKKKVVPLTPTPSLVGVLRAPYSIGDVDDATSLPEDRPVGPHVSNATLVTPGGTSKVAYTGLTSQSSSQHGAFIPPVTSGTLLEKACAHLVSVDARLQPLIDKHRCPVFSPEGLAEKIDPFQSLASGIMSQQVSGAAAKSIENKFVALFNEDGKIHAFPQPSQVVATDLQRLRTAGLSQRKAEYIQGLAEKFVSGEFTTEMLMNASDEEVMEKLIAVRGLGKWSVEMFACFGLKRVDILSTGDLGVQRGMAHFFGKDVQKLKAKGGGKWKYMSEQDMLDKSAPFAPYRSLFMWYMWKMADVEVDVMQSA